MNPEDRWIRRIRRVRRPVRLRQVYAAAHDHQPRRRSAGDIHIDGQRVNEVDAAKRGTAMVFQSYALYPHMTVAENMGFGLKMAGESKAAIREKVAAGGVDSAARAVA